ncbi:MAG: aspartyl protease family protein [Saprospiraceae bacterium]|nr:aspartyl protease family protein [Saprospiraceae bacterium]
MSFDVDYNKNYDFIILLNGKDSCLTRITTILPKVINYHKKCDDCKLTNDTIPFELGLDNKTYIKAAINNTKSYTFLFDLGVTSCILKESMSNDCKVTWNGSAEMGSVTGTQKVKSSNVNEITIGKLVWDSVPIFSTKHTGWGYKGIIGNSVLQEKIIELNYDTKSIIFHTALPEMSNDYFKIDIQIRDGVPYIPVTIDNGKTKAINWFVFDTGYDDCLLVDNAFAKSNQLYGSMKHLGNKRNEMNGKTETVLAPTLLIGEFALNNVPIDLQNPNDANPYDRIIIGNDVLKRFNAIIDYQTNIMYLKPNTLLKNKYNRGSDFKKKIVIAGSAVLLAITGILLYKKFK